MGEKKFQQTALVIAVQGALAEQSQHSGDLRVGTPGEAQYYRQLAEKTTGQPVSP